MLCLRYLLIVFVTMCLASGHPPSSVGAISNTLYSLPELFKANTNPANWEFSDDTILQEGRIVLTPKKSSKGALWHKTSYSLVDSFTMEWTFRNVNFFGKSKSGLAFWFISDNQANDKKLFNGPSTFDGLQMVVDNNSNLNSVFRALLGDGSETINKESVYSKTFGSCLLNYQDSSVPSTVRLTYSRNDKNLLKLQINNKVCFQTRKIQIPKGNYLIGVSAENANNNESFEILQMKFYDTVISESLIPNINGMPQPKMLTKVINQKTGSEKIIEKSTFDSKLDKISQVDLYQKLDKLESRVLANDIHLLDDLLSELVKSQEVLGNNIANLVSVLEMRGKYMVDSNNEPISPDNYKDFITLNERLGKLITEQQSIRESAKNSVSSHHVDQVVQKVVLWLSPLIAIMSIMTYYTVKIRHEIIKAKLL